MPKSEELEDDLKRGADGGETVVLDDDEDDLPEGKKPDAKPTKDEDGEDERLAADQREEGETEAEREAIRARRREEKKQRKNAQREAMERTRRELASLRAEREALAQRLAALESGQLGTNAHLLDQRIAEAEYRARQAEDALAQAIANSNGEVARDAVRLRDRALAERAHYMNQRQAIEQAARRPQQQDQGMDPSVQRMAQGFIQKNADWYDPQGGNEDSAIVLAIDNTLAAEGYDPRTKEYWDELEKRAAKRLPDRFTKRAQSDDDDDDEPAPRRKAGRGSPPVGGRGEYAPPSTRREVYVSAERKQAMIEAGVWDDPVARKRMLKRYAEIDRQSSR